MARAYAVLYVLCLFFAAYLNGPLSDLCAAFAPVFGLLAFGFFLRRLDTKEVTP